MKEVELKLQVPPGAEKTVERWLTTPTSVRTRLQAVYFDTPDRRLARAGVAVRLRKEGRRWVQTLKCGPAHGMERGEHNVSVPVPAGLQPALDIRRHDGTPPAQALAAALAAAEGEAPARLVAVYATDIWRRHRQLRVPHGVVELAFDRGEIRATAADGQARHWPVCELEIELVRGSPLAVVERARALAERHGLWLDVRTKAERGDRLARGLAEVPAVKAVPLKLERSMSVAEAWRAVLRNTLAQALPNWSEVAGGEATAEHVHQLRVALRRLRSAHKLFEGWPGVGEPPWGAAVSALFQQLGATRDRDALAHGLQRDIDAALDASGEPPLVLPPAPAAATDAAALAAAGLALIDVLAATIAPPAPGPADGAPDGAVGSAALAPAHGAARLDAGPPADAELLPRVAERLQDWHAQALRDIKRFDTLEDAARHRLRKRLKRLRYAIEFTGTLFPRRAVERYLAPLREAQESLGLFNDVCVAQGLYREAAKVDARAWFALGWLTQQRERVLQGCRVGLKRLRKAEPFWPH